MDENFYFPLHPQVLNFNFNSASWKKERKVILEGELEVIVVGSILKNSEF